MVEKERVAALLTAVHEAGHAVVARALRGPGVVHAIDVRTSEALIGSSHIEFEPPARSSSEEHVDALAQVGAFFAAGRAGVGLALEQALGVDVEAARADPWLSGLAERGCALDDDKVMECAGALLVLAPAERTTVDDAIARVVRAARAEGADAAAREMRAWAQSTLETNAQGLLMIAAELVRTPRMSGERFEELFEQAQ